jgi:hypothetical protein
MASIPSIITNGIIPFIILAATIFLYLRYLKKKYSFNRAEYIQTLIIIFVMSYTVLSLTGIFFRGKGMNLVWPWV